MGVLEFGCGTGSTALIHEPHVKHILVINFLAKIIKFAQAKVDAASVKNVTIKQPSIG
jgi:protein-L-isoaspartate O-methyltransferase